MLMPLNDLIESGTGNLKHRKTQQKLIINIIFIESNFKMSNLP